MKFDNSGRAEVLIQALPYIQKYAGKTVVVKYGGSAMKDEVLKKSVMGDIVLLSLIGVRVVLIHGGGPEINDTLGKMGKEAKFVDGLRVTDEETVDVVQMVLAGKINKDLVSLIQQSGGKAVGISGVDGNLIRVQQLSEALGFVGDITSVNMGLVDDLLNAGYIPVVATLGCDEEGMVYNINADTAAARIAGALGAESMLSMTDVAGILSDRNDPASVISVIGVSEVPMLTEKGVISGGMIPKVSCCVEAIRRGVKKVFIVDGGKPHAILMELLTDEGLGTMVTRG